MSLPHGAPCARAGKDLLRMLTCGSVDDGKSTLIGRLLYECGSILDDQLGALQRESRRFGTTGDDLDFSLLLGKRLHHTHARNRVGQHAGHV